MKRRDRWSTGQLIVLLSVNTKFCCPDHLMHRFNSINCAHRLDICFQSDTNWTDRRHFDNCLYTIPFIFQITVNNFCLQRFQQHRIFVNYFIIFFFSTHNFVQSKSKTTNLSETFFASVNAFVRLFINHLLTFVGRVVKHWNRPTLKTASYIFPVVNSSTRSWLMWGFDWCFLLAHRFSLHKRSFLVSSNSPTKALFLSSIE